MTKRISQLTAATGVQLSDTLPLVQNSSGQTKKMSVLEFKKNTYVFSAYRSASWTQGSGAAKVTLDAELYDSNSNFDTTLGRYTAPVNGLYHFSATVATADVSGIGYECWLYKNGVAVKAGQAYISGATNPGFNNATVSGDVPLSAGDYIELFQIGQVSGTGITGAVNTFMDGHLVAPQ